MNNKTSRQRTYQLKQYKLGKCQVCGKPLDGKSKRLCEKHRLLKCKYSREWNKNNPDKVKLYKETYKNKQTQTHIRVELYHGVHSFSKIKTT